MSPIILYRVRVNNFYDRPLNLKLIEVYLQQSKIADQDPQDP